MEWIDQFQQMLSRPLLTLLREYWLLVLIVLSLGAWWLLGRSGRRIGEQAGEAGDGEGDKSRLRTD